MWAAQYEQLYLFSQANPTHVQVIHFEELVQSRCLPLLKQFLQVAGSFDSGVMSYNDKRPSEKNDTVGQSVRRRASQIAAQLDQITFVTARLFGYEQTWGQYLKAAEA
jgi:hypothetical protein